MIPNPGRAQRSALRAFGLGGQLDALIEELGEAIGAAARIKNDKGDWPALREEIVGVVMVASSLKDKMGTEHEWAVDHERQETKLRRKLGARR